MDRLRMMHVFAEVVRQQGFSMAARKLHMSTTAVSRHVRELEDWLGVELLHRTTRHLALTDAGHAYLERCRRILDEVESLERISQQLAEEPQGRIQITAPVFLGRRLLANLLPGFLKRYPGVRLNIQLIDRYVNLIEEGFDLAIRIAKPPESDLVSLELGVMRMILAASPAYLKRHGAPATIEDLREHNCIVDSVADYAERWPLLRDGKTAPIRVAGNVTVNNGELVREMALAGLGITLLPDFFVVQDLREGRLVVILPGAVNRTATISAVYPRGRYLSAGVRVLVEYLETEVRTFLAR